jgi:hypothetical protein
MSHLQALTILLVSIAATGCTTTHGRTYASEDWKQGQRLGRVLVLVPSYTPASPAKDRQIRHAIHEALAQVPGTTIIDDAPANDVTAPISESSAVEAARKADADTVCVVTLGQFGGRYLLTFLPPGWDSRTTVQYSLRLLDARTGDLLLDSVRERTAGGYLAIMTATYDDDLTADLTSILSPPK